MESGVGEEVLCTERIRKRAERKTGKEKKIRFFKCRFWCEAVGIRSEGEERDGEEEGRERWRVVVRGDGDDSRKKTKANRETDEERRKKSLLIGTGCK